MSSKVVYWGVTLLVALVVACAISSTIPADDAHDVTPTPGSHGSPEEEVGECCLCGQRINMTIVVRNSLQEPFFELRTKVKDSRQRELIHQMEVAATQDKRFRFGAEHFGSLGYMITKLNGVSSSVEHKTYWHISSQLAENALPDSLEVGASSYVPVHNEIVVFNLTTWGRPGTDGH